VRSSAARDHATSRPRPPDASRQQALTTAQIQVSEIGPQIEAQRAVVAQLEAQYRERQRPERPYSALAKARHTLSMLERRQVQLTKKLPRLEKELALRHRQLASCQALEHLLQRRLEQFEADNRANRCPIHATFRLDAGFGNRDNVALLIEMGYEVYTKPYSDWLTPRLKRWAVDRRDWTRVGHNAEMIAWKACSLSDSLTRWIWRWNASRPAKGRNMQRSFISGAIQSPRTRRGGSTATMPADNRSGHQGKQGRV